MQAKWKRLEENIPSDNKKEIVCALKELYSLFDEGLVRWFANLFDPETCAFYWSNSARDTVGYMPSLEETYGALTFVGGSGMAEKYGGDWTKAIPKWLHDGARDYFISLQDEDGFFYNRRWDKEFITEHGLQNRLMRDVDTAERMISALGGKPKYDRKKPEPKKTEEKKEKPRMLRQFESPENFKAYLNAFKERYENESDPDKRAFVFYSAGGEFQSTRGYIAEPEYRKIFFDFLKEMQDENTGLWADTVCYGATNSLHKIAFVYNALGEKLPNVDKMLEGVMKIISLGEDEAPAPGAVDVYNAWSCLPYIYTNILRHADGTEEERAAKKNAIKARVFELAPEAIRKGAGQLRVFKQADGGFSYNRAGNQVMAQGCRISVSGAKESDVNGTAIAALALKHHIFLALELSEYEIPLFSDKELKMFNSELERIKKEGAPEKKRLDYVAVVKDPASSRTKKWLERLEPIADITDVVTEESAPAKRELVFGHSGRKATEIAEARLQAKLEGAEEGVVGFSIVTAGPSIAIVCSDDRITEAAVEHLLAEYPTADTTRIFPLLPYLKERGERIKDEKWAALEKALGEEYGKEITRELRKLYDIFPESMVSWYANPYEPETGGFYWSNSARNTLGYLPSLEETYEVMSFIADSGMAEMYDNDWVKATPEWMKKKIADFFYNLQDEDTFFYLPQWPKEYIHENNYQSRITRDRGSAKEVLRRLGYKPKYTEPVVKAAPKEEKKEEKSAPKMLWQYESLENFKKYLAKIEEEYISETDTYRRSWLFYSYGNLFQSTANYVRDNPEIREAFIEFFERMQSEKTGMWCDDICFNATNGLHKIASVMNCIGHRMKHIDKMVETTMKIISSSPEENPASGGVDIYNAWSCFPYIYYNILHFGEGTEEERIAKKEEIKRRVFSSAAETIRKGTAQMLSFKRADGSYSYGRYGSVARGQGVPIALSSQTPESDVNGAGIASIALKQHIFMALEVKEYEVPLYTEYEHTLFMNEIERIRREGAPKKRKGVFSAVTTTPDDEHTGKLVDKAREIIEVEAIITPDAPAPERQLLLGSDIDHFVTRDLKAKLERALEGADENTVGFALGSSDASFGVVWSDDRVADAALEFFAGHFPAIDTVKVFKL